MRQVIGEKNLFDILHRAPSHERRAISFQLSAFLEIGGRKSEDGNRKSEIGNRKSEIGDRKPGNLEMVE
jgi:hypothetical protein